MDAGHLGVMFAESAIAHAARPATRLLVGEDQWAVRSYAALAADVRRLASALTASGVRAGDKVAYLASNSLELLSAHFAVPLIGGVLVAVFLLWLVVGMAITGSEGSTNGLPRPITSR